MSMRLARSCLRLAVGLAAVCAVAAGCGEAEPQAVGTPDPQHARGGAGDPYALTDSSFNNIPGAVEVYVRPPGGWASTATQGLQYSATVGPSNTAMTPGDLLAFSNCNFFIRACA